MKAKEPRYFEMAGKEDTLLFGVTGKDESINLWSRGMKELTESEFLNKLSKMNGRAIERIVVPGVNYTVYWPFAREGKK